MSIPVYFEKEVKEDNITYKFEAEYEYQDVHSAFDEEIANDVFKEIGNGNLSHYFSAKVTAYREFGSVRIESDPEYLGCCSYESFDDFMKDAYFNDMKEATKESLNKKIQEIKSEILLA